VRSEQRSLAEKELPPGGLRRIWPLAAWVVGYRPTGRGMRPPRALPQAKLGATNVIVFMFMTTKSSHAELLLRTEALTDNGHAAILLGTDILIGAQKSILRGERINETRTRRIDSCAPVRMSLLITATFGTLLPNPGEFLKTLFHRLICGVQF